MTNRIVRIDYSKFVESDLVFAAQAGNKDAANELVSRTLWVVRSNMRKYIGWGADYDDLFQAGSMGILRALRDFDPRRGFKFSTYASWWVRRDIQRLATKAKGEPKKSLDEKVGEDSDKRLGDMLVDGKTESGFDAKAAKEESEAANTVLGLLPSKEFRAMELRYGYAPPVASDEGILARLRAIEAKALRTRLAA